MRIACGELSRAIDTLDAHHRRERSVVDDALERLDAEAWAGDADTRRFVESQARRLKLAVTDLRTNRGALLEALLPLRGPLVDLLFEAQSTLPDQALFAPHVEADPMDGPSSPDPSESKLSHRLAAVRQATDWNRHVSHDLAVEALGPAYLLAHLVEHPEPPARALRGALRSALDRLVDFVTRLDDAPR